MAWTGFSATAAAERRPEPSAARLTPDVQAVNKALPWVVNIATEKMVHVNDPFAPFFSQFFQNMHRDREEVVQTTPLGSGIIIDSHGLVVTNYHVVQRAQTIEVRLWNGESYRGRLVGYDQPNDLALLQLEECRKPLQASSFAQANDLLLGETVISIGNPYGLEHSVSKGVLSAFNRSFSESGIEFSDILQTDAAINPGNSGGPLINLDGDLIGINLAIRADAQGIGFAIPMARIERFLSHWLRPEHFSQAYLGIESRDDFLPGSGGGLQLPEPGAGSPLALAGLSQGDEIIEVNGKPLRRYIDFARETWRMQVGEEVLLRLADGRSFAVKAAPMPDELLLRIRLGLELQPLTAPLRQAMGISDDVSGLIISDVIPQDLFSMQKNLWRNILKRGDLILKVDGKEMPDVKSLVALLASSRSGQAIEVIAISINPLRRTYQPLVISVTLN